MQIIEMFRTICLATMVIGWIWNRKQWEWVRLIDGDGLIFAGFVGLLIAYPSNQRLVCLILVICMILAYAYREKLHPNEDTLGVITIVFGIASLTLPNVLFLSGITIFWSFWVILDWLLLFNLPISSKIEP